MEAANTEEITVAVTVLPSAPAEPKVSSEPTVDVEFHETECLDPMSRPSHQILKYETTEIRKYSRNKELKLSKNGK